MHFSFIAQDTDLGLSRETFVILGKDFGWGIGSSELAVGTQGYGGKVAHKDFSNR